MSLQAHKRHRLWIDPQLQTRYIMFNVVFLLLFSAIIGAGTYFSIWRSITRDFSAVKLSEELQTITRMREYEVARTRQTIEVVPFLKEDAKALSQHQKETLSGILMTTNRNLVPVAVVVIGIVIAGSLILSHRFAGPVFRLRRSLSEVSAGNLAISFSLRKKDEMKNLASEIESTVQKFSDSIVSIKGISEKIISSKSDDERKKYVEEIQSVLSKYKTRG